MALIKRNDPTNTASVADDNSVAGVYVRCPHCGLTDMQYSIQGYKESHYQITRVGAIRKHECGRCRHQFHTIEIGVPAGVSATKFYEKLTQALAQFSGAPANMEDTDE